jgi:hypothetical protein
MVVRSDIGRGRGRDRESNSGRDRERNRTKNPYLDSERDLGRDGGIE